MKQHLLDKAAGPREGDFVNLGNAWADVTIMREGDHWRVEGHVDSRTFLSADVALAYALEGLAEYERGRMD